MLVEVTEIVTVSDDTAADDTGKENEEPGEPVQASLFPEHQSVPAPKKFLTTPRDPFHGNTNTSKAKGIKKTSSKKPLFNKK